MIFQHKILLRRTYRQRKHTNDKLAIGWSRCRDFNRMRLAEWCVGGKVTCVFTSFFQTPNDLWETMLHFSILWRTQKMSRRNLIFIFFFFLCLFKKMHIFVFYLPWKNGNCLFYLLFLCIFRACQYAVENGFHQLGLQIAFATLHRQPYCLIVWKMYST